jgi:hypothetical protein
LSEIRLEYENNFKYKESRLHEIYQKEKEAEVERERNRFLSKIDTIKAQLKQEYEREFKVKNDKFVKLKKKIHFYLLLLG